MEETDLQRSHREYLEMRQTMTEMHDSFHRLLQFNGHLREQIRRNLYYDPPPGITYGIHVRSVGTQTDFVNHKQNGAAVRPIKGDVSTNKRAS